MKLATKILALIAFVPLLGFCLFGQMLTGPAIPDSTAQRLYFLGLSNMDSQTRQAHLTYNAQLPAADILSVVTAVNTFKTSYDEAVTQYNEAVGNGSGFSQSELSTFQRQQANITAIAMGYVQSQLSEAGYAALQGDIAIAKNQMEIPYAVPASGATVSPASSTMGCCYSSIASQTVNVISSSPFHATVTFTRTLEGSASVSDPSIKHQGTVTAHVGAQSQTNQGQWLTPNIYINLSASVTLDTNLDSCLMSNSGCSDMSLGSVTCSVAGLVYTTPSFPTIKFQAGVDSIWYGDPIVANPLTGSCNWTVTDPNCKNVCRCTQQSITFSCHDSHGINYESVLNTVLWSEFQFGSRITGTCFHGTVFDKLLPNYAAPLTCSSSKPHWGIW
jgi:hypothetical protein